MNAVTNGTTGAPRPPARLTSTVCRQILETSLEPSPRRSPVAAVNHIATNQVGLIVFAFRQRGPRAAWDAHFRSLERLGIRNGVDSAELEH